MTPIIWPSGWQAYPDLLRPAIFPYLGGLGNTRAAP